MPTRSPRLHYVCVCMCARLSLSLSHCGMSRNVLLRWVFDVADQVLNQSRKYAFLPDRTAAQTLASYLLQVRGGRAHARPRSPANAL
jgi:hypothetical protein